MQWYFVVFRLGGMCVLPEQAPPDLCQVIVLQKNIGEPKIRIISFLSTCPLFNIYCYLDNEQQLYIAKFKEQQFCGCNRKKSKIAISSY